MNQNNIANQISNEPVLAKGVELADYVVSELNNWMEANAGNPDFDDYDPESLVEEAGFGYTEDNPNTLQYICGGDVLTSKYSMLEAAELIKNEGLSLNLINELQQEIEPIEVAEI